jgi:hypothetical protein
MKLKEFVQNIIKYDNVIDILSDNIYIKNKEFIYETLWDIIFKFGYCDIFPRKIYKHYIGNSNNGKLKILKSLQKYLEENNVISGNKTGCSDHILYNIENKSYIFTSCKYFENDNKHIISDYDIQNIISIINHNDHIYKKYTIFVLVHNKSYFLEMLTRSNKSSEYITKYCSNEQNILDIYDLNKYFQNFKQEISNYNFELYDEIFISKKDNLQLRFHQHLFINKTLSLLNNGIINILYAMKARSGKTYICGGLIYFHSNYYITYNVLILTPCPKETINQFTDDLFYKFKEFNDFSIYHIKSSDELKTISFTNNKNIIICSKQLLQHYTKNKRINSIKNLKINLLIFDENHFGGTTKLSEQIIKEYCCKTTVKIFMTATYKKSQINYDISEEACFYWDIESENLCKNRDIIKLTEKYGNYIKNIINNNLVDVENQLKIYDNMPNLHILTNMFDIIKYDEIKHNIKNTVYGFSFDTLFSISNNSFKYKNEVKIFLRYISGSNKIIDFPNGDKSFFGRITQLCSKYNSRSCFTQLWFLPPNGIDIISQNMKKLMLEDRILKHYNIMIVNSKQNISDIKNEILKQEQITKYNNQYGLIILTGNMLSLGITLSKCDVVFLLHNSMSSEKFIQQMYRCMTETSDGSKKCGFVIDMNISRVITAMYY